MNYSSGEMSPVGRFSALVFHNLGYSEMAGGCKEIGVQVLAQVSNPGAVRLDMPEHVFLALNEGLMTILTSYRCERQRTQCIVLQLYITSP